jgi:hypothetical protein
MVVHAFNPSTQEAKAGRSRVLDQPVLHTEILSQATKTRDLRYTLEIREVLSLFQALFSPHGDSAL